MDSGRSVRVEIQLISLFHDLSHSYDDDIQTDLISLDLGKAFDTIAHQRLLLYIRYGIRGRVHQWISKFLHNR